MVLYQLTEPGKALLESIASFAPVSQGAVA